MRTMRLLPLLVIALSFCMSQTNRLKIPNAFAVPVEKPVAALKHDNLRAKVRILRQVAQRIGVSAHALAAILAVERGRIGQARTDTNGTADVGPAQINTVNLQYLAAHGVAVSRLDTSWRTNILAEAILLRRAIHAGGSLWMGVAMYHSATPGIGKAYAVRVWGFLAQPLAHTIANS